MVHEQGEIVDSIEQNIESTTVQVPIHELSLILPVIKEEML